MEGLSYYKALTVTQGVSLVALCPYWCGSEPGINLLGAG